MRSIFEFWLRTRCGLTNRLIALGRAHDLVRPLPGQGGKAALLDDLITVLLAPYDDMGAFSGRVRVSVPRMGVGEAASICLRYLENVPKARLDYAVRKLSRNATAARMSCLY
jgi:hypothetical protein